MKKTKAFALPEFYAVLVTKEFQEEADRLFADKKAPIENRLRRALSLLEILLDSKIRGEIVNGKT